MGVIRNLVQHSASATLCLFSGPGKAAAIASERQINLFQLETGKLPCHGGSQPQKQSRRQPHELGRVV